MGLLKIAHKTSQDYLKESAVAGVSHAAKSKTYSQCLYWSLLFVAGLGATIPGLVGVIKHYYTYPVTTKVKVKTADNATFPAVTICGLNRIHCYELQSILQEYSMKLDTNVFNSDAEREECYKIHSLLDSIWIQSRCRHQMCEYINNMISELRFDSSGDENVFHFFPSMCWYDHPYEDTRLLMRKNYCYTFLQIFTYANNITDEAKSKARENWEIMNCTQQEVCTYIKNVVSDTMKLKSESIGGVGLEHLEECATLQQNITLQQDISLKTTKYDLAVDFNLDENELRNNITLLYMELPKAVRIQIGHQFSTGDLKGFFHSCSFLEEDCNNKSLWSISINPEYGNCFTFNAKYNNGKGVNEAKEVTMTGGSATMSIVLYINQAFYMPLSLTKEAGARITIHNPKVFPMTEEYGINLKPNTASSIGFQQHAISRKADPYISNCTSSWQETDLDKSLMVDFKPNYTMATCKRYCIQEEIINRCNCFQTQMDLSLLDEGKVPSQKQRPCSMKKNGTDYICFNNVMDSIRKKDKNCDTCRVACHEVEYPSSLSTAVWPSDSYWRTLAANLGTIEIDYLRISQSLVTESIKMAITREYVKADLYFQTLNVKTVEEEPVYTITSLVSALGGAFSLYLGIAIILLFEMLELAVLIIFKTWHPIPSTSQSKM